jgi:hypothetical protein
MKSRKNIINWDKIEFFIFKSFTGQGLTHQEQTLIETAYKKFPLKYKTLHQTVKNTEIETRKKLGF